MRGYDIDYIKHLVELDDINLAYHSGYLAHKTLENRPNGTVKFFTFDYLPCCQCYVRELKETFNIILKSNDIPKEEELIIDIARCIFRHIKDFQKYGITIRVDVPKDKE